MRLPRSASSPQKAKVVDQSIMQVSNRATRSSTSRSPPTTNSFDTDFEASSSSKRNWYTYSADLSPSSNDEELQPWALDVIEGRKVPCSKKSKAQPEQATDQNIQLITPSASPNTSFSETEHQTTFLDLPIEVHQLICTCLPSDRDVANYAQICTKTCQFITSSVWRKRFLCQFDMVDNASSNELLMQYKERKRLVQQYIEFDGPPHPLHRKCLTTLRDLIIQSNAQKHLDPEGIMAVTGLNHDFIRKLMANAKAQKAQSRGLNIVDSICNTEALFSTQSSKSSRSSNALILVVQLCLVHLLLDPDICELRAPVFHRSQQQVYRCYSDEPIFKGKNKGEINLPWLLHVANFFKFHFKQPDGEGLLSHFYCSMDKIQLPRSWSGKLKTGTQELGRRWKGAFTYLNERDLEIIRHHDSEGRQSLIDETNEANNGFQDLTIFFDIKSHPELRFPDKMERIVRGKPVGPLRDALTGKMSTPEVKDFFGLGYDGTKYHFNGRIHSMPPQQGVPGFQRVTMLKYIPDRDGNYGIGQTSGWAYEGCVLPGNEIMLGRWWRVGAASDEPSYTGPFIFWRVEESDEDKLNDATTALEFLDSISNFIN